MAKNIHELKADKAGQWIKDGHEPPVIALALFLECEPDDVRDLGHDHYGLTVYGAEGKEYAIGTEEEADEAHDKALESYLDECVLDGLPEIAQRYLDREAWKRDAEMDGRAHALNSYDGTEEEEEVDGQDYLIYRTN